MTSSLLPLRVMELAVTYVWHSTLFLVAAGLLLGVVSRIKRLRRSNGSDLADHSFAPHPRVVEWVWKGAATLGLVTAPLSLLFNSANFDPEATPTSRRSTLTMTVSVVDAVDPEAARPALPITPHAVPDLGLVSETTDLSAMTDGNEKLSVERVSSEAEPITKSSESSQSAVSTELPAVSTNVINSEQDRDSKPSVLATTSIATDRRSESASRNESLLRQVLTWFGWLLIGWVIVSFVRLVQNGLALQGLLATCSPVAGEPRRVLDRLVPRGASIRLLRAAASGPSPNGNSRSVEPFACGVFRWTIVIPDWVDRDSSPAELQALLAHEAAHLIRRDPAWQWLGELLCTCLAFQPLNFVARRGWQRAAELLCDDWAVEKRIAPTTLAQCLARIAEGRMDRRVMPMGLTAVGQSGSLTSRVNWLLRTERGAEPYRSRGRMLTALLTFSAGLLVGAYGPRLELVMSLEAAHDAEAAAVWQDIHDDLIATLNDLTQIESRLANDLDPSLVSLVTQLRERASLLREELSQSRLVPSRHVGATQSSTKGIR